MIYAQPNIITSRITGSFSYDTRNASVDPTSGRELSLAVALAGLGGDVRTYQPTISFTQFFPMRRKKSEHPEVFGFRILAGTVGSFAITPKVRDSQSLAFVDGVPIFERFFLGDEFTIRGYNVRSIGPIVPLDTFITSQNVVISSTGFGPRGSHSRSAAGNSRRRGLYRSHGQQCRCFAALIYFDRWRYPSAGEL